MAYNKGRMTRAKVNAKPDDLTLRSLSVRPPSPSTKEINCKRAASEGTR